jgi:hypothetical protein
LYDEMAGTSVYCPPPTSIHPTTHPNSFFAAAVGVRDPNGSLLSTEYGISPSSYHGQESGD